MDMRLARSWSVGEETLAPLDMTQALQFMKYVQGLESIGWCKMSSTGLVPTNCEDLRPSMVRFFVLGDRRVRPMSGYMAT